MSSHVPLSQHLVAKEIAGEVAGKM